MKIENNAGILFIKVMYVVCIVLTAIAIIRHMQVYTTASGNIKEVKKVAITFDDGPHSCYTQELLDGLKKRNVHATFFVTGEHASIHEDIIRRMHLEGHLIGNHTYSHMQLTESNYSEYKQELIKTNEVIENIIGKSVEYVRPPYGEWNENLEKEVNMFPVFWNVDPLDWCNENAVQVARNVLDKVEDGSIILMHDYYESSVEAALIVVDELIKQGYSFVTVDEILFD